MLCFVYSGPIAKTCTRVCDNSNFCSFVNIPIGKRSFILFCVVGRCCHIPFWNVLTGTQMNVTRCVHWTSATTQCVVVLCRHLCHTTHPTHIQHHANTTSRVIHSIHSPNRSSQISHVPRVYVAVTNCYNGPLCLVLCLA